MSSTYKVAALDGKERQVKAKRFVLASGGIENCRLMLASKGHNPAGLGNHNDMVGRFFMEHPNLDSGMIKISDAERTKRLTSPWLARGSDKIRLEFKLPFSEQQRLRILNHTAFVVPGDVQRGHMAGEVGFLDKVWRKLGSIYDRVFDTEEVPVTE